MKATVRNVLIAAVLAALVTAAHAASSAAQADKVAKGFLKMEAGLDDAKEQMDAVLKALNAVATQPGGDLTKKYDAFAKETKKCQSMFASAKKRADKSRGMRDDYLKTWEKNQKKIQNPDLQKASEARRDALMPTIDKLKNVLGDAEKTFTPFMQDLTDLNLYLGNNLTPPGIASAGELTRKCNRDGAKVNADLDEAIYALKELGRQIAPGVAK